MSCFAKIDSLQSRAWLCFLASGGLTVTGFALAIDQIKLGCTDTFSLVENGTTIFCDTELVYNGPFKDDSCNVTAVPASYAASCLTYFNSAVAQQGESGLYAGMLCLAVISMFCTMASMTVLCRIYSDILCSDSRRGGHYSSMGGE